MHLFLLKGNELISFVCVLQQEPQTSDVYEHIKDAASQSDAQTLDAATEDQLRQQQQLMKTDEPEKDEDIDEEIPMEVDEEDDEPKVGGFEIHVKIQ